MTGPGNKIDSDIIRSTLCPKQVMIELWLLMCWYPGFLVSPEVRSHWQKCVRAWEIVLPPCVWSLKDTFFYFSVWKLLGLQLCPFLSILNLSSRKYSIYSAFGMLEFFWLTRDAFYADEPQYILWHYHSWQKT